MSGAPPQPPRQRTPQSPPHPSQSSSMLPNQSRPLQRPNQYPRYYRGGPAPSSSPPVLGWTPRTPAAPRTPVPPHTHAAPRTPVGGGRLQHANQVHQSPSVANPVLQGSPRISPTAAQNVKPSGIKPNPLPMPIKSPVGGAQTPSWLKGPYRPQPPPTPGPPPVTTIEAWCKERLEAIKATAEGTSEAVPELRKVMEDLDSSKVAEEMALISNIRKDYWKARERQRKAAIEQRRAEREVQRIDLHAAHIESKICRLRSYARFIDNGWVDEPPPKQDEDAANTNSRRDSKGGDGREGEKSESPRPKKQGRRIDTETPKSQSTDEIQAS